MESAKNKLCPIMRTECKEYECAWWCEFAKDCSVPLIAGMFADSDICNNVFEGNNVNEV